MERTMKKCSSCDTYSPNSSEYCEYCGEVFYKKYRAFSGIINTFSTKISSMKGVVYPFEKYKQLCLKIEQEIQRVEDISNLLVNIRNQTIRAKIEGILAKINGHIDSLIKCRCDIEYLRISISLNGLLMDSKNIESAELVKYEAEFMQDLVDAFSNIRNVYNRTYLESYFENKKSDLEQMIENMSVLFISSILSNTSIVKELEYGPELSFKNLEENIDKINYEIDRLSAELSM
jgi:hypothetical protein